MVLNRHSLLVHISISLSLSLMKKKKKKKKGKEKKKTKQNKKQQKNTGSQHIRTEFKKFIQLQILQHLQKYVSLN